MTLANVQCRADSKPKSCRKIGQVPVCTQQGENDSRRKSASVFVMVVRSVHPVRIRMLRRRPCKSVATPESIRWVVWYSRALRLRRCASIARVVCVSLVRVVEAQIKGSPVDTFPSVEIGLGNVVLQWANRAVGVFSFQRRFEEGREPTYKTNSSISKRMHRQECTVI